MTFTTPPPSGSGPDPAARTFEETLTDLESLADELVESAGPDAVAGVGDHAAAGGVAVSRLASAAPRLRALGTRLDTLRLTWLPVIEAELPWQTTGARNFSAWLARTENVSTTTAKREARTGRALRDHLPTTRATALAGGIGADHVRVLVDVAPTSDARKAALAAPIEPNDLPPVGDEATTEPVDQDSAEPAIDGSAEDGIPVPPPITGEAYLTGLAGACDPSRFRRVLKRFGQVVDPDADDRGYREATEREHLEVSPTFGGWHVNGFLTDEHGQLLATVLGSMMGAPTPGDDRTPTQRRAQALADVARDVLDNGRVGTGAAVRPHVHVTVSLTELIRHTDRATATHTGTGGLRPGDLTSLTAQPATFTGASTTGSVVPRALLRRLTCDAEVTRVVFGADGTAIDVGRAQRTVTGQMRKAVIARDQHCVYPGCDQPPSRCEVHHALRHWADGGETSVANSALLCWHHHTLVDTTGITMAWEAGSNPDQPGRWTFTNRYGHRIELRHACPRAA
ncbi:DUF222 domain-containing protein [Promicromonospora sp. NPDC023805]|uniref:HNH endonuclease signature motif containing protein n=1 Tax=Promicromonospora sp. NPDC023805 TaxID=3154696 RepID=UPI0033CAFD74